MSGWEDTKSELITNEKNNMSRIWNDIFAAMANELKEKSLQHAIQYIYMIYVNKRFDLIARIGLTMSTITLAAWIQMNGTNVYIINIIAMRWKPFLLLIIAQNSVKIYYYYSTYSYIEMMAYGRCDGDIKLAAAIIDEEVAHHPYPVM